MKVKHTREVPDFSPIQLEIIIESKEERDLLYALFNNAAVVSEEIEKRVRSINRSKLQCLMADIWQVIAYA